MKKILGVSLVAMMAVTTARAEIASKAYVDTNFQAQALVQSVTDDDTTHYPSGDAVFEAIKTVNSTATNAIQGVKVNGSALTPDGNKIVDVTVPTITDTYNAASTDGMSGVAVASAIANATIAQSQVTDLSTDLAAKEVTAHKTLAANAATDLADNSKKDVNYPTLAAAKAIADAAVSGAATGYVASTQATTDGILTTNATTGAVEVSATIPNTKVSGLGSLATASTVTSSEITNGTIATEDLDSTLQAAITAAGTALQQSDVVSTYASDGTAPVNGTAINAAITSLDLGNTYQAKGDYATAAQGALADTSLQKTTTVAADGQYVLTKKVTAGVASYAWEMITRTGNEGTAPATTGEQ